MASVSRALQRSGRVVRSNRRVCERWVGLIGHLAPVPVGEVHDVLRAAGFAEEGELLAVHQGTAPRGRQNILCDGRKWLTKSNNKI